MLLCTSYVVALLSCILWICLRCHRLGATPVMELMIAAGKAVPMLQLEHGLAVDRMYTGSFMTSLDMAGIVMWTLVFVPGLFLHDWIVNNHHLSGLSITVMKVDEAILERLDAPTKAPAWPVGVDGMWLCFGLSPLLESSWLLKKRWKQKCCELNRNHCQNCLVG